MLRKNLKDAIKNANLYIKEIATKSGVNKRTIDKWVGSTETEPKVNDFYKVCIVLQKTMEEIVGGGAGTDYVRNVLRNDPECIQVPDRILPIVECLLALDDRELIGIKANVEALVKAKKDIV